MKNIDNKEDKNFITLMICISVVLSILIIGSVINDSLKHNNLKIIIDGKIYESDSYEYIDDNVIIINEREE